MRIIARSEDGWLPENLCPSTDCRPCRGEFAHREAPHRVGTATPPGVAEQAWRICGGAWHQPHQCGNALSALIELRYPNAKRSSAARANYSAQFARGRPLDDAVAGLAPSKRSSMTIVANPRIVLPPWHRLFSDVERLGQKSTTSHRDSMIQKWRRSHGRTLARPILHRLLANYSFRTFPIPKNFLTTSVALEDHYENTGFNPIMWPGCGLLRAPPAPRCPPPLSKHCVCATVGQA